MKKPAYIHPQGVMPNGLFFRGDMVESLLRRDIIAQCDDCGREDPDFPTYMIVGDDDEEERNADIVLSYEVPAP